MSTCGLTTPSLSRLRFDTGAYEQTLKQSVGPGNYVFDTVNPHCTPCLQGDSRMIMGTSGASICSGNLVDVESDLHNIGRRATLAPSGLYRGDGSPPSLCPNGGLQPYPACDGITAVDTRLVNPPCTLRGTGWNRWEWLCRDPQDHALIPFDANIDTSLVVKDNHRPHIARPIDPSLAMPPGGHSFSADAGAPQWVPCSSSNYPVGESVNMLWRTCSEVGKLRQ